MLKISEVLLNPAGTDSGAEWVELEASNTSEFLGLYRLENGAGRGMLLPARTLAPGERAVFHPSFALRNQNERILLRRAGSVAEEAEFLGQAPDGKSYNRVAEHFLLGEPTPGLPNRPEGLDALRNTYASGELRSDGGPWFILVLLAAGALLAAYGMLLSIYANPRDHNRLA